MEQYTKPRNQHHRFGALVAHLLIATQLVLLIAGWQATRAQGGHGMVLADAVIPEGAAEDVTFQLARFQNP